MPSITRRRLGAALALAAAGYGAHRLSRGATDATFASWTPEPGTWPHRRYDPANTAHNPNATPPRESPSSSEVASVPSTAARPRVSPLVGPDHVAAYGSGLVVSPRGGGSAVRTSDAPTPVAGYGPDGHLHAVTPDADGESSTVVGYDADGRETYRVAIDADHPNGVTVGTREVYVGTTAGDVLALDPASGRRWQVGGTMAALGDGRLYAVDALDGTVAYGQRRGTDRRLRPGPERVWSTGHAVRGFTHPPAVADGRLLVGTYEVGGGVVVAFDAESGTRLWGPRALGQDVSTPALVGDRGYTAVGTNDREAGRVVALDLASGETRWRDETGWHAFAPVVADGTLVVAGEVRQGGTRTEGRVRAYDAAAGDVLWTHAFEETRMGGLALVGDRVLVAAGASLYELG